MPMRHWIIAIATVSAGLPAVAQSTRRVSVSSVGFEASAQSARPAISSDGRFIAFDSQAGNLAFGGTTFWHSVYVHDLATRRTTLESVNSSGATASSNSHAPSLSADGRYLAFYSFATNLTPGDTPNAFDVFVRDRTTGQVVCASISSVGAFGNASSTNPTISADGRFVAYRSDANNLVPGDSNGCKDVFVRDLVAGITERVSVSTAGIQGTLESYDPVVSADGRFVAFASDAPNLVAGDTNDSTDVFLRDRLTIQTTRVSATAGGGQANSWSAGPAISLDGRYVAFVSNASDLVTGDSNGHPDVFRRDLVSGQTIRLSVGPAGTEANSWSDRPSISDDGNKIAFLSAASNLVGGDTNASVDVFVRDVQLGQAARQSVDSAGTQGTLESEWPSLSTDGAVISFASRATNLVPGDTNNCSDIFVRGWMASCFVDGDGDGFGAGLPVFATQFECGAGYSTYATDCNDLNAFVNPAMPETCNGVDDDCDVAVDEGLSFASYYPDADGDGFGATGGSVWACTQPTGHLLQSGDCNDSDPTVYPGAVEFCDGQDNDCNEVVDDGFLSTYCTAGTTVQGCVPQIAGIGVPSSAASNGFEIVADEVPTQRMGLIFYGLASIAPPQPWGLGSPSYLCIYYPVLRTGAQNSGGSVGPCDGELRVDFNAFMTATPSALGSPFIAADVFYAQAWFRDPGAAKQTNLSDGLRFTLCN